MLERTQSSPRTDAAAARSSLLIGLRRVWLALAICLFILFLVSIPATYSMLQTQCASWTDCLSGAWQMTVVSGLVQAGIQLPPAALYLTILYTVVSLVFWGIALLVYCYSANKGFALLMATTLVLLASGGVSLVFANGLNFSGLPAEIVSSVSLLLLAVYQFISLFFLTFPNGKFYGRWNWLPFVLICLNTFFWVTPSSLNMGRWAAGVGDLWILLVYGSHLVAQIVRYRRMYTPIERQQTKWLLWSLGVGITLMYVSNLIPGVRENVLISATILPLLYLPIALSVGIAILRYRLWDIDILIQRTLVYGALTGLVVGIYVLVVGTLGALFQNSGNLLISLLATGVVAVLFQPLRERLQRLVEHYVYGERNSPYSVISRLSERLETIATSGTLLPGIAETVAQTLKLPYVAIALKSGDAFKTDAVYGQPADRGQVTTLPLIYGQEMVGQMIIGQAAGDKTLDSSQRQLLENIARQAGIAAHAVQLSIALQQSRQQIVTAREEERRRLRRDLHDGLGPALAAHTIKIGAARALIESSPQTASNILAELEINLANSLNDIRRLVYNLRPPALDQLGLIGALCEFTQQCNRIGEPEATVFTFAAPEQVPPLPAAVEVAAYRITQEAINNVIRHAHAQHGWIEIRIDGALQIVIRDDGCGLPASIPPGIGLNSMRERCEELGGSFRIESSSKDGTQIQVLLPLPTSVTDSTTR